VNTVSVTLGTLIDRVALELTTPQEQGSTVQLPDALAAATTSVTLTGDASITDVIEFGPELVLVTNKSADVDPIYTLARGYFQTTAQAHAALATGEVNPQWPRVKIGEAVKRSFARLESLGVQLTISEVMYPAPAWPETSTRQVLEVPAHTRSVVSVWQGLYEVGGWEYVPDLPTSEYSTGKIVRLPRRAAEDDEFYVRYRVPFRWSSWPSAPSESSTVEMPEGTEDLPASYAVAWLTSSREISRSEIDRAEEWNRTEPTRNGISQAHVRARWQEFYRALDEARRLEPVAPRRSFRRRMRG
jgi:hypothetical protein